MMLLSCSLWCHDISFSHQEKGLYVDLRFSLTCMLWLGMHVVVYCYSTSHKAAVRDGGGDSGGRVLWNTGCVCLPWFLSFWNRTQTPGWLVQDWTTSPSGIWSPPKAGHVDEHSSFFSPTSIFLAKHTRSCTPAGHAAALILHTPTRAYLNDNVYLMLHFQHLQLYHTHSQDLDPDDERCSPHPVFARFWLRLKKQKICFEIIRKISHPSRRLFLLSPSRIRISYRFRKDIL